MVNNEYRLDPDPNEIDRLKKQKLEEFEEEKRRRQIQNLQESYNDLDDYNPGDELINFNETKFDIRKSSCSFKIADVQ